MASNIEEFTTRIFLNSEEARNKLSQLKKDVEFLCKKKDEAAKAGDWKTFNSLKRQLDGTLKQMSSLQTSAQKVSNVLNNLSGASVKEIRQTIRAINAELSSGAIARGSSEWKFLNEQLQRCNAELRNKSPEMLGKFRFSSYICRK